MVSMLERIDAEEHKPFLFLKGGDPTGVVDSWPLMGSPVPVMMILSAYFIIVFVGPKYMKNKPGFQLDKVMLVYNAIQVAVAASLVYRVLKKGIFKDGFLLGGCNYPVYTRDRAIQAGGYTYFISKITELLDTVFFVLRKKNNQISILHVFHHSSMVLFTWGSLKYTCAGDGTVLAFLNCCVHVIMYSYYLLAGLGPKFHKYLWWKKYVTEIQLFQFILMLTYLTYTHFSPKCFFSPYTTGIILSLVVIYLVLFLNFYIKSYTKKKSKVA
ncbi:hypothetical protein O0L34_g16477 [Tuta absoluta]|nr:hypothetical protein O0L34_g16477 [Tuta absoluta]